MIKVSVTDVLIKGNYSPAISAKTQIFPDFCLPSIPESRRGYEARNRDCQKWVPAFAEMMGEQLQQKYISLTEFRQTSPTPQVYSLTHDRMIVDDENAEMRK
jgi:hypothetical protein